MQKQQFAVEFHDLLTLSVTLNCESVTVTVKSCDSSYLWLGPGQWALEVPRGPSQH